MWLRCETNSEEFFVWRIMGGVGGGLDGGYEMENVRIVVEWWIDRVVKGSVEMYIIGGIKNDREVAMVVAERRVAIVPFTNNFRPAYFAL